MACNMYPGVLLTREVCESFKERYEKSGKRSLITFTSALASIVPIPGVGQYSATKIFGDYVAWGLSYELKRYKVDVSAWRAAGVTTKIIGKKDEKPTSIMEATPEQYVEAAFGKCTTTVHSGYFPHEMIHLI